MERFVCPFELMPECSKGSVELRLSSSSPIEHHMTKDEFQPPIYLGTLLVSELSCEVGLKHGLVTLSSNMLIVCNLSGLCLVQWCSSYCCLYFMSIWGFMHFYMSMVDFMELLGSVLNG
jgi:hypothetical protein